VTERMILAGWGGQGMILLGKLVANVMMNQGKEVTYFPSYGAEVRGGTAHCHVIYSDEPIYSPIAEQAEAMVIMNQPSYTRFHGRLTPTGTLLINTSMIRREEPHPDATVLRFKATDEANRLGEVRVGNMLMLGAVRAATDCAPREAIEDVLRRTLTGRKAALLDLNLQALARGEELASEQLRR